MKQSQSQQEQQPVQIRQRVIGAIVLVSLGVIFIPMLLNSERGQDDGMPVFGSNIPGKPGSLESKATASRKNASSAIIIKSQSDFESRLPVDEHTPELKTSKDSVASFAEISPKKSPTKSLSKSQTKAGQTKTAVKKPKEIITAKTTPVAKKPAKAWAIQVGSFSERRNAFKLRNKLRSKKYTAFVDAVKKSNRYVYRVRVGPEVKRDAAVKIQQRLKKELKLSGLVVSHP